MVAAEVAAGVPPAVEPGILPGGLSCGLRRPFRVQRCRSGRQDAVLYGSQDGCRYNRKPSLNTDAHPMGEGESPSVGGLSNRFWKLRETGPAVPFPVGYVFSCASWWRSKVLPASRRQSVRSRIVLFCRQDASSTLNRSPIGRERVRVRGALVEIRFLPGTCFCT